MTTPIGKASLQVPRTGFGTAPLATAPSWGGGEPISQSQALSALEYAYQKGIRFFDTAPNYVRGLAETRTGLLLKQVPRESVVIATKVGFDISTENTRPDYSRDGVLRSLEGSLRRLQVDNVDIVHIHDPDNHYQQALDEAFPALEALRAQGVIKAIGAGMNQWQMLLQFAKHADFDCFMIAGRYTLLEQGATPLLNYCHEHHIAIFAASIYNSGILATGTNTTPRPTYNHGSASGDIRQRVAQIEAVCAEFGVSLHTVATQFPIAHPAITSLVVGFQKDTEVQAYLDALTQDVPIGIWGRLKQENLISEEAYVPRRDIS
ncbi:MAG: aldo/keto reductase [bacterium]|nr:aldo/keto reductase [bacterium]